MGAGHAMAADLARAGYASSAKMTVNTNVRCIEWFDASQIRPANARYVLGWYDDGFVRVVRLNGDTWHLQQSGPGCLRQEFAKPTHWCEFPEGPEHADNGDGNAAHKR
jgi:hypothetical protein